MLDTNKSYLSLVLGLGFCLFYQLTCAQRLLSLTGVFPASGGVGFDLGYHQISNPKQLGFGSVYFGQGKDQVETSGELVQFVDREERTDEIVAEGDNFHWKGVTAGINLNRYFALGVSLGHRATFLTQQREDPFQTLGIRGKYFTQYRTENRFDIGIVGHSYLKVYRSWYLLGSAQLTTQRLATFQVGIALWVI